MNTAPAPAAPLARLLVVDDEERLMTALCDTLREESYEVIGLTSAEEAVVLMRERKFDLLLTDLMMPKVDGIGLLQASLEQDPDLVVVLMTGHGTIATAVKAMQAGALDYVLKPFKLGEILPVLTRALLVRKLRLEKAELARLLRERSEELEASNTELDAFARSVSHDLRAPLRVIGGYTRMVEEECRALLSPQSQKRLRTVITEVVRMNQLVDDLLKLSRLNRQPLIRQPVAMAGLVAEVVAELRRDAANEPVQLEVEPFADCHGDPALLRQVVLNLLSNACKFTRGKDPRVVEIGSRPAGGETEYFVRDNGAGFDEQYAPKLFQAFQRLHREDEFEGTGVGLSIVKRIIERHGGRVWARGQVGQGATFSFTLPRESPAPPPAAS